METINTPYDDAFRTLLQDCPELVIPLINELFGTDYTLPQFKNNVNMQ